MSGHVLIVEDDKPVREALGQTLELAGLETTLASSFVVAKDVMSREFNGVVVSDIRMPGRDGLFLLDYAQNIDADLPVILLTGEGDIPMAVSAISNGAFDFLEKPCPTEQLVVTVQRALRARALVMENRSLKSELVRGDAASRLVFGVSDLAEGLRNQLRMISALEGSVLIEAAPGSGVSKVAEVLHLMSDRVAAPFVKRAAAQLKPDGLLAGLEVTGNGSLFLDEISLLPVETQFALLEELDRRPSARVIAGTARALAEDAGEGAFNADLFYRLDALRIRIPSLKERPEDIPILFRHYVSQACEQAGISEREIGSDHIARLMARDWPGNARALMNAAMQFALGLEAGDERELGLAEKMAQIESSILTDALRLNRGNASATAEQLRVPRKTLYDKFTKYGIRPEDYR